MAILSCHVSIKLPPKISDGQHFRSAYDTADDEAIEMLELPAHRDLEKIMKLTKVQFCLYTSQIKGIIPIKVTLI